MNGFRCKLVEVIHGVRGWNVNKAGSLKAKAKSLKTKAKCLKAKAEARSFKTKAKARDQG